LPPLEEGLSDADAVSIPWTARRTSLLWREDIASASPWAVLATCQEERRRGGDGRGGVKWFTFYIVYSGEEGLYNTMFGPIVEVVFVLL